MADGLVQVSPDSSGKKIDTSEITVGLNTVERQRINIADPTSATSIAAVKAASTAAVATDPALVVAVSPNNTVPVSVSAGSNVIGALTANQSVNVAQVGGTAATATAKGTQAANGIGVQELKDSGRVYISITLDAIAGITTEALVTITINKDGTVTTGTSYTITAGKTLRLQSITAEVRATSAAALTAARVRLRTAASGILVTSPLLATLDCTPPTAAALAGATGWCEQQWPDGLEIPGGRQIAISQVISATTSAVSLTLVGYEY